MKVAICDDEEIFLSHIKDILVRDSFDKEYDLSVESYTSGEEVLDAHSRGMNVDVLFLDIRMKDMDGLETARRLRQRGCNCLIVFLTSLFEYVQRGYEVRAFRYLLKEQMDYELGQVMADCRQELMTKDYFSFSYERKNYSIRKAEILYFESKKRLIYLHTAREAYQFYQKLDCLETELRDAGFLRCHRSFLVQERYVKGWRDNLLWLENDAEIPISRSYEKEVNRRLMLRMG